MKERPILFSAPMVRAILEGTKTQTRRAVKIQPPEGANCSTLASVGHPWHDIYGHNGAAAHRIRCPYGKPGDILWVRESFQPLFAEGVENHWETDWKTGKGYSISYPATDGIQEYIDSEDNLKDACKPSIHMPRWASRILLEVTGVRVERLQDINEADAKEEGAKPYLLPVHPAREELRHVDGFALLWESINGHGSWSANPWVWVVEFKRAFP